MSTGLFSDPGLAVDSSDEVTSDVAPVSASASSNKRASAALASVRFVCVDCWKTALAGRKKSQKFAFSFSTGGSALSSAQTPTRSGKKCLHNLQQCRSLKHPGQLLWRLMGRGMSTRSWPQFQHTTLLMSSTSKSVAKASIARLTWSFVQRNERLLALRGVNDDCNVAVGAC